MKRPPAGKRAFEARGRRAASLGLPLDFGRRQRAEWPAWARMAFSFGWHHQRPITSQS